MYTTITNSDFHQAFVNMGREDNFSYEGRNMLFDYLDENYPDTELDAIALCCEYVEETYAEIIENYFLRYKQAIPHNKEKKYVLDYLNHHTMVVGHNDDRVVYQAF